jgi:hypothetical protein
MWSLIGLEQCARVQRDTTARTAMPMARSLHPLHAPPRRPQYWTVRTSAARRHVELHPTGAVRTSTARYNCSHCYIGVSGLGHFHLHHMISPQIITAPHSWSVRTSAARGDVELNQTGAVRTSTMRYHCAHCHAGGSISPPTALAASPPRRYAEPGHTGMYRRVQRGTTPFT